MFDLLLDYIVVKRLNFPKLIAFTVLEEIGLVFNKSYFVMTSEFKENN